MRKKLHKLCASILAICLVVTFVNVSVKVNAETGGQYQIALDNVNAGAGLAPELGTVQYYVVDTEDGTATPVDFVSDFDGEGTNVAVTTGDTGGLTPRAKYSYTVASGIFKVVVTPASGKQVTIQQDNAGSMVDKGTYTEAYTYTMTAGEMIRIEFRDTNPGGTNPPDEEPQPGENPQPQKDVMDLVINGVTFTDVENYSQLVVPDSWDLANMTPQDMNITVTKLNGETATGSGATYADGFKSNTMYDEQNRDAMEIGITSKGENSLLFKIEFHSDSIGNVNAYPGFYIFGLTLVKDSYRGVEVGTNHMPDMYDFSTSRVVDLKDTSAANPGIITAYYGDDTIQLASDTSNTISNIQVGAEIPANAVTVDVAAGTIKVNSNYYSSIPVTITLDDGTVGYMQIERIGLDIQKIQWVNASSKYILHGASAQGCEIPSEYYGKSIMTASFYHTASEDYNDYNLIATVKLSDGTTQTNVVKGIGTVPCIDSSLAGSDYIVWSGDEIKYDNPSSVYPVSVSVTAVKANATSGSTFGGASFGSGAGVTWTEQH